MSTEREELADLLCEDAAADRAKTGGRALLVPVVRAKAEAAADKILAAGYSKQSIELAQAMRGAKTLGEIIRQALEGKVNIPEEAVEAAANAISQSSGMRFDGFWSRVEDLEPGDREYALKEARAALEAAAPIILAHEADRARLERIESAWGNR